MNNKSSCVYTKISQCRICSSEQLTSLLSLGNQSLTGVFPKDEKFVVSSGPLELVKCGKCDLVQLAHSYEVSNMYGANYGYRSGLNGSMVRHLNTIVSSITKKIDLRPDDLVIDIGSNDSTTLRAYPDMNLDLVGIDPSGAKFKKFYPSDVKLIPDFFSAKVVKEHLGDKKAKVITSIAMFYDLEQPLKFMQEIAEVLSDDGIWVAEQSYLKFMLDTTSYDTICHEHLEYYGFKQIYEMAKKVNLKVLDVEFNDVNGGSFRFTVTHSNSKYPENKKLISSILENEERIGLYSLKTFEAFKERTQNHKVQINNFFKKTLDDRKKVLGYGASTKGNVLLQYCGITSRELPCIAEVNDDKFGAFTPGTAIPIVSEATARGMNPDYFFVLPWHFKEGILKREKPFLDSGKHFVFPLPGLEII
ncbi:MAG: class I SAM-dependent methyltransferase [Bacteriovoracaceae bacterium]